MQNNENEQNIRNENNEYKLFENFVVIGPNPKSLENLRSMDFENDEIVKIEPSIIFDLDTSEDVSKPK